MKRWICLFLVMSSSLAHPNDREHGDFYRGLTGLKAQIDEINRDLILLENATLSSSEVNRRLARIEQQIDDAYKKISEASDAELREWSAQELEQVKQSLQVLNMQDIRMQLQPHLDQLHKSTKSETLLASRDFTNETSRNLATMALALISLLVAMISAAIAWMNHVQSSRTKAVKDEAESDLVALREATDRELIELQMNTQRQINSLTERHENDIVRLTQDHKEEVRRLEQLNLDKVQHAETAFENLMGETETQNGLIFKNLAVSIYLRRFLVEDGYDRFFNDLTLTSIDETATVRCDPSILREVISIQEHAISRFEKVKNKLEDAKMLYYEALLDLAFYEAEMSRFGILNVDATQRINENLVAFEQNLLFWLNEERSEYKTPERLPRFIFRVICMVDSLVFIRGCLKLHEIFEEKPAKDEILSQVSALLVENDMATVRQITDVIESKECSSLWSKYTNFKEERPKLFEY